MQMTEISFAGATPIDGYGPGFFRVAGEVMEGAILVTVQSARGWGGFEDTQPLLDLAQEVDVIFIGTGAEVAHIPADLRHALEEANVGVEAMSSPAACRTYNVLLSEGRRVAVAALPV
ncbi:Mth938-like domain-containing protein [uncultured Roseovarius sp.]|uniref:Mth938-like domain-containing protein n=1 Tax=uncultured Roseovarius sp. TaxID=293344 RepID=UPI002610038D|nr:Mth938-like domain-containing protein [uncultured Roseovarius sp.]